MQDFMRRTQYKDKYLDRKLRPNEMLITTNFSSNNKEKSFINTEFSSFRAKKDKINSIGITSQSPDNKHVNDLKIVIGD